MPPSARVPAPALRLPAGFRFGTVTAAYQIEGAVDADGRGPCIWDAYAGDAASVAADHYRRLAEDIALIARLGAPAYKFSISWSRIQPSGRGAVNAAGLDFYDRLVDGLLEAGVQPVATLHHIDLPQALEQDGGWLNRSTADAFGDYAAIVAGRLADRVRQWVPISEPAVAAYRGYGTGDLAPGRELHLDSIAAAHHMLLGHGHAITELRRAGAAEIGCANYHAPIWPASDEIVDMAATKLFDALWNGVFLESMVFGRYPADIAPLLDDLIQPGDMATIRQPLDFYGVNYYSPLRVGAADENSASPFQLFEVVGHTTSEAGWPVVPSALREFLVLTRARYRAGLPPLVITECGLAHTAPRGSDGVYDDQARIDFLDRHLEAVAAAIDLGVDVRGFFVWTLLDSWEWVGGFSRPYGLVHVDPVTLERTPKASFHWYADLVRQHAIANGSAPPGPD